MTCSSGRFLISKPGIAGWPKILSTSFVGFTGNSCDCPRTCGASIHLYLSKLLSEVWERPVGLYILRERGSCLLSWILWVVTRTVSKSTAVSISTGDQHNADNAPSMKIFGDSAYKFREHLFSYFSRKHNQELSELLNCVQCNPISQLRQVIGPA